MMTRFERGDVVLVGWYACLTLASDADFAVFAACNASGESGDRACDQAAWALIQRYPPTKTPRD